MCTALPPAMRLLLTTSTVTGFPSKSLRTTTIPNLNQSCLARRNSLSFSKPTVPSSLSLSVCNVPIFFFIFGFICSGFLRCKIYDSLSFDELGFMLCCVSTKMVLICVCWGLRGGSCLFLLAFTLSKLWKRTCCLAIGFEMKVLDI